MVQGDANKLGGPSYTRQMKAAQHDADQRGLYIISGTWRRGRLSVRTVPKPRWLTGGVLG